MKGDQSQFGIMVGGLCWGVLLLAADRLGWLRDVRNGGFWLMMFACAVTLISIYGSMLAAYFTYPLFYDSEDNLKPPASQLMRLLGSGIDRIRYR